MSQNCRYVAIDGTVLRFGYDGKLFLGQGNIREYMHTPYSPYGKIISFENEGVRQYQIPLYISALGDEGAELRNRVHDVFERDIHYKNNNPNTQESGKLFIGDYYLKCFISGSAPSGYLSNNKFLKKLLTITTDSPTWIKEINYLFSSVDTVGSAKKYAYKYPYKYNSTVYEEQYLMNPNLMSANFKIVFEAQEGSIISNPYILIGDNSYRFNITLNEGEKLIVNSRLSSITLVDSSGRETDALYTRDKSSDIFKKISEGKNPVSISASTRVYVTLFSERSEPEWI